MSQMITITQLEYALAVEKHRHFGKASHACGVTQPTLSQQLQKLEDEIGIVLFDRIKKPLLSTPEGKRFLDQARAVLREHQKLIQVSQQVKKGELAGEFRLAVIPTLSNHLLPCFLNTFSKNFPKIELYIEEMKTETILHELSDDKLDGAILATPVQGENFKIHPLYYEPFFVYLTPNHPLLKKPHLSREDLDPTQMWLLQDGHCFKTQVLNFCSLPADFQTASSRIHFQSGSLDALRWMVRSSGGYTLLPAMMVHSLNSKEFTAQVRPFRNPVPVREVGFLYRRDHWKLQMIKAIEDSIIQSLPPEVFKRPEKNQIVLDIC